MCVGWGGRGRGSFLSLGNQPRVDSWRRAVPVSLWCSGDISAFCPWGRWLTPCQSRAAYPVQRTQCGSRVYLIRLRGTHSRVLHLWAKAQSVLFSVCWSSVGLECVPRQTFFHWNELAQSWAGKSNPLGLRLHAWLDFPPPPLSRCLGEATKA